MESTNEHTSELRDEDLCALACGGDRMAEEQLVVRYQQLTRACSRPYFLAGGDSEDLIQEAMFGLLKAIREFDPGRSVSFHTFAEVCVRNRIRSAVTAAARGKHTPLNHSVPYELAMQGNEDSPEELVINREEGEERLEQVVLSLGAKEIRNIIEEDGEAELTCQFCRKRYRFDREHLKRLLYESVKRKMN